jgi:hypothetical protein
MSQISQGLWSEVDGISSGLFSVMNIGTEIIRPTRLIDHPEIEFEERIPDLWISFLEMLTALSLMVCAAPQSWTLSQVEFQAFST